MLAEAMPDRRAPSSELAHRLLGMLSSNAHTICDGELQPIGLGLFPLAALTNHDCDPSACQSFERGTLVMRALRPLAAGDAVTIAYVDLAQPAALRQSELMAGYCFQCACTRCQREEAWPRELQEQAARQGARLVEQREAALAAIDREDWTRALAAAATCCELCEALMPPESPSIGIERARLGKLLAHAERLEEAEESWWRARRVLAIAHGDDALLVQRLERDLGELATWGSRPRDDDGTLQQLQ